VNKKFREAAVSLEFPARREVGWFFGIKAKEQEHN